MDAFYERLPVVPSSRASSGGSQLTSSTSVEPSPSRPGVCVSQHARHQMALNEHAKTRTWLPIEYEVEIEPDTETELSSDDE